MRNMRESKGGRESVHKLSEQDVYWGDSIKYNIKDYKPFAQPVPFGTNVRGMLFDGYPQVVKQTGSESVYGVKIQKDFMVSMRDGVRLALDVYRPDVEGEKFPALLAFGLWGVYHLPFMRTVTHTIHFGKSYLLLPLIPASENAA
jgi:predicted acyl esterase